MKTKEKNKNWIVIFSSLLLIILGMAIIGGKYLYLYLSKLENDIKIEEYFEDPIVETEEVIIVDDGVKEEKQSTPINTEKYIAVLEIPKINLKKMFIY